jgi:hypothetical protein
MTFFHQAMDDGTLDRRMEMSEKEFEMMLRGMIQDSNVWSLHQARHHDAKIVPIFQEDATEFEQKIHNNSKKQEEPSVIQYDMHSKKFTLGCQCGAKFEIDVKNDKVEQADPSLKMKEMPNYDRGSNQEQQYGGAQPGETKYDMGPKRIQHNPSYNSTYKS